MMILHAARLLPAILTGTLLAFGASPAGATLTNLYAFGDSLSDAGNAYALSGGTVPRSPPYDERFSNGPVAVERLASRLGDDDFAASTAGGTDYAVGGARTGTGNYLPALNGTGMQSQVDTFVTAAPTFDPASSLFVVWGGANDIFAALDAGADPSLAAADAVTNLTNQIFQLAGVGAEHFLVPNLPDLGSTPLALDSGQAPALTQISQGFNQGLGAALLGIRGQTDLEIQTVDTFGLQQRIIESPDDFGFTNVTDPCLTGSSSVLDGSSVCTTPSTHFYWDMIHPTAKAHRILGDAFYEATTVPEPSPLALVTLGAVLLGVFGRRFSPRTAPAAS